MVEPFSREYNIIRNNCDGSLYSIAPSIFIGFRPEPLSCQILNTLGIVYQYVRTMEPSAPREAALIHRVDPLLSGDD
jgi:hypothetical protein